MPAITGGQVRKLAKNAAALAVGGIAAQAAFVLVEVLIARRLSQELYGVFSTVFVLTSLSLWVVDAGLGWKLVQDGSRRAAEIPRLLGTSLVLRVMIFLALYPLAVGLVSLSGYGEQTVVLFSIFFSYALIMVVQDSLVSVYAAQQRMEVSAVFQGLTPAVICVLVYFLIEKTHSINSVAYAYLAGSGAVTLCWLIWTAMRVRPWVDFRGMPDILKGSYQYGLSGLLTMAFYRIDIVLLSLLRDMSEVGIYAAAAKLLDLAGKIPILAARVVAPMLFQKSHEDPAGYRKICNAMLRAAAGVAMAVALTFNLLAEPLILFVFGEKYAASAIILQVLGISFALRFVSIALQTVLSTSDLHARRTQALGLGTAFSVGCNLVLIPLYGAIGAAGGVILGNIVIILAFLAAARRPLDVGAALRGLALASGWATLAVVVSRALTDHALLAWALAVVLFAAALTATGFVSRKQITRLARAAMRGE
ncbi:flippase [soil metagenome]